GGAPAAPGARANATDASTTARTTNGCAVVARMEEPPGESVGREVSARTLQVCRSGLHGALIGLEDGWTSRPRAPVDAAVPDRRAGPAPHVGAVPAHQEDVGVPAGAHARCPADRDPLPVGRERRREVLDAPAARVRELLQPGPVGRDLVDVRRDR